MKIYKLETITQEVVEAFERLMPQLSANCNPSRLLELKNIITSEGTILFVVEDNNEIIGTLTLVINQILTGNKVWIEDVVVDKSVRGQGIGKELMLFAINFAKNKNLKQVNLTSSPEREAANKLYQKLGFFKRETNVYRMEIK